MTDELSKGFTGIEINGVRFSNIKEMLIYMDKQRNYILDLEKENAELKEELKKWKDEWQEQVQKATDEGYTRTLQTMQLTKAKELLKKLYLEIRGYMNDQGFDMNVINEVYDFIKSEVEK